MSRKQTRRKHYALVNPILHGIAGAATGMRSGPG